MDIQPTIADARKLVKNRNFKMPIIYEEACEAIQLCQTLEDAVDFVNAAEALATWFLIYKKDKVGKEARQLKLLAHRKMGELAQELAPGKAKKGGGRHPGPVAKLQEYGLSRHEADAANHLAKMNKRGFNKLMNQDIPPAPTSVTRRFRQPGSTTQWELLRQAQRNPFVCAGYIRSTSATKLARSLNAGEVKLARKMTIDLMEWLDEFEQALPSKK